MNINKLMQMVLNDAHKLIEHNIKEQEKCKTVELIEGNRTLIMARTISRLIPQELIAVELQESMTELNKHYCKEIYNDDETVEAIHELTGIAKNSAIDVLAIVDDMEID